MSKFNQLYSLIIESINKQIVYDALKLLEDSDKNIVNVDIPKNLKYNKFIAAYEKKLEQYSNAIINAAQVDNFKSQNDQNNNNKISEILKILRIKGATQIALNGLQELLTLYPNDVLQLYNNINVLSIETIRKQKIYFKRFNFSQEFLQKVFEYKQLNKTASTANIGNGQLLLSLIINDSSINGLDDLNINGEQYNVKYISKSHKNDNAIISIKRENDIDNNNIQKLINYLKQYSFNKNLSKNATLLFPSQKRILNNIRLLNLIKDILKENLQNVNGFILVGLHNGSINMRAIRSEAIINNPSKYLNGLHNNNQHFGFYFTGEALYENNN